MGDFKFKHLVHAKEMTKPNKKNNDSSCPKNHGGVFLDPGIPFEIQIQTPLFRPEGPMIPYGVNKRRTGSFVARKALRVIRAHAVLKGRSSCEVPLRCQLGELPRGRFGMNRNKKNQKDGLGGGFNLFLLFTLTWGNSG